MVTKKTRTLLDKAIGATGAEGTIAEIQEHFSTGIAPLDVILSGEVGKGIPSGRVTEIYGDESVGKTTLCCLLAAQVQRQYKGSVVYFDSEATLTKERAVALGIDWDTFWHSAHMMYCEDVFEAVLDVVRGHALTDSRKASTDAGIIIWDTVAGTEAKSEHGKQVGEGGSFGPHARILSEGFRKLCQPLGSTKLATVFCNQMKIGGIGNMFATERQKEATLGGKAMRFHSHIRLKMEAKRKYRLPLGGKKFLNLGEEIKVTKTKDKERGAGVAGTDCILILQKVGEKAGTFNEALSCLRTLQNWGMYRKEIIISGHKLTPIQFEKMYDTKATFRAGIRTTMELMRRTLLKIEQQAQSETDDEEEPLEG